ncbi:MAG: translation initiation factor IF-3, partial [Limisphaerales bacterium]
YEQAKQEKDAKKHHHANKVKEIQLSARIDPHDFGVKLQHAVDFLCEEMKVKVTLRFRGREMAHKEFGFQQIEKFIKEIAPYANPDAAPKLIGKGINVMLSPLPRIKRAKNPKQAERDAQLAAGEDHAEEIENPDEEQETPTPKEKAKKRIAVNDADKTPFDFGNNPFAELSL